MGEEHYRGIEEQLDRQGVADIQRIRIKRNGEGIQTDTYVVYFSKHSTPKVLKITEWHYEAVQTYVYQPQQYVMPAICARGKILQKNQQNLR